MNSESYETLIELEKKENEKIAIKNRKLSAILSEFKTLADKYPKQFEAYLEELDNDITVLATDKFSSTQKRILTGILFGKIRISKELNPDEKKELIGKISNLFERIRRVRAEIKSLENNKKNIRSKIETIKEKVIKTNASNKNQISILEQSIEERKKKIEELERIFSNELNSNEMKEAARREIEKEKANIESIQKRIERLKAQEKNAGQNITEESAQAILDEETKKKLEPITEEPPKKPKNRHFAPKNLIEKVKKGGKIIGGIALVAGAVALAVTNPALLLAIPGIKVANDFIKNIQGKSK